MPAIFRDLVELADESCRTFAARPLFGTKRDGRWTWTTYAAFDEAVAACRAGLAALGVGASDRVSIVADNRVEWAIAAFATYGVGATFVPLGAHQPIDEWRFALADSGATTLFATESVVRMLEAMGGDAPSLRTIVRLDAARDDADSYAALIERGRAAPVPARRPGADAIAALLYTSTFGMSDRRPVGVLLSHGNLVAAVAAMTSAFPIAPHDRTLSYVPWAHAYGQIADLYALLSCGASTALCSGAKLVDELANVHPTLLVAVPRMLDDLYVDAIQRIARSAPPTEWLFRRGLGAAARKRRGTPLRAWETLELALANRLAFSDVRSRWGGSLAYVMATGGSLAPEVAELFEAVGVPVYEGYGLTEASLVVSANRPDASKPGSVGKPLPGVSVTIDASMSDDPQKGEIVVVGPNVMRGYQGGDAAARRRLEPDGGLRTGDVGWIDADGFLHVDGPLRERYALEHGELVNPSPLEEALKLSPYIANAMVHGEGKPFNIAVVVLDPDSVKAWSRAQRVQLDENLAADATVYELIRREVDRLSAGFETVEKPRGFVLTSEPFSTENGLVSPTSKLRRANILARYRGEVDRLFDELEREAACAA